MHQYHNFLLIMNVKMNLIYAIKTQLHIIMLIKHNFKLQRVFVQFSQKIKLFNQRDFIKIIQSNNTNNLNKNKNFLEKIR